MTNYNSTKDVYDFFLLPPTIGYPVHLALPPTTSMSSWNRNFTTFMKAMWFIDEVEARWQTRLPAFIAAAIPTLDVGWDPADADVVESPECPLEFTDLDTVVGGVATFIGLTPAPDLLVP